MITLVNIKFEPAKKEFNAFVDGALVATGVIEFTSYDEQEKAKKSCFCRCR